MTDDMRLLLRILLEQELREAELLSSVEDGLAVASPSAADYPLVCCCE